MSMFNHFNGGHNLQEQPKDWFYIVSNFDGHKTLLQHAYSDEADANQAAMAGSNIGEYEIVSYQTRNPVEALRRWKMQNQYANLPDSF